MESFVIYTAKPIRFIYMYDHKTTTAFKYLESKIEDYSKYYNHILNTSDITSMRKSLIVIQILKVKASFSSRE